MSYTSSSIDSKSLSSIAITVYKIDIVEFKVCRPRSQCSSQIISSHIIERLFLSDGNNILVVVVCVCRVSIDGECCLTRCNVYLLRVGSCFDEDGLGCGG